MFQENVEFVTDFEMSAVAYCERRKCQFFLPTP